MANKVLFVMTSPALGGATRSTINIIRDLKKYGYTAKIIFPQEGPATALVTDLGFEYEIIDFPAITWRAPLQTLKSCLFWVNYLHKNKIDIVHTNVFNTRNLVLACRITGTYTICHVRFAIDNAAWFFRNLPKPDAFIFNSNMMQKQTAELLQSCPKSAAYVVYNSVDEKLFTPKSVENQRLRVCIIANFHKVKGHEDFFDMASIVLSEYPHVVFDVVGGDTLNKGRAQELQEYSKKIKDHVVFHGSVKNVAEIVREVDIVVCPSHEEPFGRCLIEAMACAKPVVATNVGGIPEVVCDKSGILVAAKSPQLLASAVLKLLTNKNLRLQMGSCGRKRVETMFTNEIYIENITRIYKTILEK